MNGSFVNNVLTLLLKPQYLRSSRLEFREVTGLAELMRGLDTDPEVMRFINNGTAPGPIEDYLVWVERVKLLYEGGFGYWAVFEGERFAGWFHYIQSKVEPEADELGYRLNRDSWGRGLATEGSLALLKLAVSSGRNNITARALLANKASARVLGKVGFELEREYQEDRFPGEDKLAGFFRWKMPPDGIL